MKKTVTLLITGLLVCVSASAQKSAVTVNFGDVLCLGTINAEYNYAVAQKISLGLSARVNPWTYKKGDESRQTQLRHQTYALNMRYWPWYVYSGLWFGAKAQYQEYNFGGFNGKLQTEEGDAYGGGLELGYAWIASHAFNINFGLGAWCGMTSYKRYSCPYCGRVTETGNKFFIRPNDLYIAFCFVF